MSNKPDDLSGIAKEILKKAGSHRLFAIYGEMGAGKTTLIIQMVKALGIQTIGGSPTYSLVNEYYSGIKKPIYHFDFYRIEDIEEVYDIGYEEYFFGGNYCFIEWPEKVEELLTEDFVRIYIDVEGDNRKMSMEMPHSA